ncbi:hypothetical protein [Kineosporia mesophila]|uniref:hypothetical protein n=1 Tax=Kineosporia mesophila TaxID=566012 RepID=UPI001E56B9FA|nr:hypothetical protein [Kineosporia mesophila]MCD5350961.1 hypothetical protein [Kineosporia mesophila]
MSSDQGGQRGKLKRAIVLTATLKPAETVYKLKRSDLDVRRSDYLTSVERWCQNSLKAWDDAYLIDNSPDLSPQQWSEFSDQVDQRSNGQITALHVDVQPDLKATLLQKGREEAKLLDAASVALRQRGVTYFGKVTGRLFVANVNQAVPPDRNQGISAAISNRLHMSDTRFFAMPVEEWLAHYMGMEADVDEPNGIMLEHVFARRTMTAIGAGSTFVSMPRLPRFIGSSGSMDIDYGSLAGRVKRSMHELIRLPYMRYSVTL